MPSDTFFPQDPSPWNGDQFVNTVHPGGAGDIFFDILTARPQDTAWDILNSNDQDTVWDILNAADQDTAWDILNEVAQATSWSILNEVLRTTAWHIFPETIEFIQKFCLYEIVTEFAIKLVTTNFELEEIHSCWEAFLHENMSMQLAEPVQQTIELKSIRTNFTARSIHTSFLLNPVLDGNTDTPEYPSL